MRLVSAWGRAQRQLRAKENTDFPHVSGIRSRGDKTYGPAKVHSRSAPICARHRCVNTVTGRASGAAMSCAITSTPQSGKSAKASGLVGFLHVERNPPSSARTRPLVSAVGSAAGRINKRPHQIADNSQSFESRCL